ncbi:MAG: hypothetical protein WBS24_00535 [Terriglobales bacterium]
MDSTRPHFTIISCLALLLTAWLPIAAQGQGVSTSSAASAAKPSPFAPRNTAVFATQTAGASAGSNAPVGMSFVGCCSNFFLPSSFTPLVPATSPLPPRHRRHRHEDPAAAAIAVPVYIPYAIGYEPDDSEAAPDRADAQYAYSADGPYPGRRKPAPRSVSGDVDAAGDAAMSDAEADADEDAEADADAPDMPEEPVAAQPSTVLVFKDGHRSNVLNYAIVGDALFDFADENTRKIPLADLDLAATVKTNDALGVEFKLPPGSDNISASK